MVVPWSQPHQDNGQQLQVKPSFPVFLTEIWLLNIYQDATAVIR